VRQGDETPNDRNDRGKTACLGGRFWVSTHQLLGIRNATAWYNTYIKSHLRVKKGQFFPTVILITDDVENRRRAEMERISCLSGTLWLWSARCRTRTDDVWLVRQYVAGMKSADSLLDIIAAHGEDQIESTASSGKRPALYPDVCKLVPITRLIPFLICGRVVSPQGNPLGRSQEWDLLSRFLRCKSLQLPRSTILPCNCLGDAKDFYL
jgi:hypothetical protein